jgi:hypothetical protein
VSLVLSARNPGCTCGAHSLTVTSAAAAIAETVAAPTATGV